MSGAPVCLAAALLCLCACTNTAPTRAEYIAPQRDAGYPDATTAHEGEAEPEAVCPDVTGKATMYHAGDGLSGKHAGCVAWSRRAYGTNDLQAIHDQGVAYVAHRSARCGSRVRFTTEHGSAVGTVIDRGPYGLDCPEYRSVTKAEARRAASDPAFVPEGCCWRGTWDLSPAVAGPVRLGGRGWVTAERVR